MARCLRAFRLSKVQECKPGRRAEARIFRDGNALVGQDIEREFAQAARHDGGLLIRATIAWSRMFRWLIPEVNPDLHLKIIPYQQRQRGWKGSNREPIQIAPRSYWHCAGATKHLGSRAWLLPLCKPISGAGYPAWRPLDIKAQRDSVSSRRRKNKKVQAGDAKDPGRLHGRPVFDR